jgi:hypothetical protein
MDSFEEEMRAYRKETETRTPRMKAKIGAHIERLEFL